MKKLASFITLLMVFSLQAKQPCQQTTENKAELLQCLDQQLDLMKRELTVWENNHLFKLEEQKTSTGRQDGLKLFNKSRQSFSLYMEQDCKWQYIAQLPDTHKANRLYKECQLIHLAQRIDLLKQVPTKPE